MAAGGFEQLRPLSTKEHVQALRSELATLHARLDQDQQGRSVLQQQLVQQYEQMDKRQMPRSLDDEQFEQDKAFEAVLHRADETQTVEKDNSDADDPDDSIPLGAQSPVKLGEPQLPPTQLPQPKAAHQKMQQEHQQQPRLHGEASKVAAIQQQIAVLHQQLAAEQARLAGARQQADAAHRNSAAAATNESSNPKAAAAAGGGATHSVSFDDITSSYSTGHGVGRHAQQHAQWRRERQEWQQQQAQRRQQQQQQVSRCNVAQQAKPATTLSVQAAFADMMPKTAAVHATHSRRPVAAAHARQASEPEVSTAITAAAAAAAAAAQAAVGSSGGATSTAVSSSTIAAAIAAAIAVVVGMPAAGCAGAQPTSGAAVASTAAAAAAAAHQDEADGRAAGADIAGSSSNNNRRAMPTPGSFGQFGEKAVQQMVKWFTDPYDGGPSVQQMESKGDILWRQQQKYGNQRWRQLNLVFRKVAEQQVVGTRVVPIADAAKAVDIERVRLGLTIAQYVKHLEAEVAARKKDSSDDDGGDGSSGKEC